MTDTQMGKAGINKRKLAEFGSEVYCFMSDEDVAAAAKANGTTRAAASMDAPTALVRLYELIKRGEDPARTDHCSTGRICECSSVERTDPEPERDSVDRCTGKKRWQQYRGMYLQCPALSDVEGDKCRAGTDRKQIC